MAMTTFRGRRSGMRVGTGVARAAYGAAKHLYKNREALKKGAKKLFTRSRPATARAIRPVTFRATGGFNEWTTTKSKMGKAMPANRMTNTLVKASMEPLIYGYRNLRAFSDFGANPLDMSVTELKSILPQYVYLINGCNRTVPGSFQPARRMVMAAAGQLSFETINGLTAGGAGTSFLQTHYDSMSATSEPGKVLFHDYTSIKMNCWGAKAKPIRFTIQLIKVTNDEYNPWHWNTGVSLGTAAQQAWEETIKQETFNPLSRIDHRIRNAFKVVKSTSFIIEPKEGDDVDTDPHVKTLEWFIRVNKPTNFDKVTVNSLGDLRITDDATLKTTANLELADGEPYSIYPTDKECLILVVKATSYSTVTDGFTNVQHGSFDIDWRTKFIQLD